MPGGLPRGETGIGEPVLYGVEQSGITGGVEVGAEHDTYALGM